MEIATFLPIAARKFCLLSYSLAAGIWAFTSVFLFPFSSAQQLSAFKSISQRLSAKMWQFLSLFSEGPHFC
jgi:hypothetical protein